MIPKNLQKCGLCRKYSHANVKCYHDYARHAFRAPQSFCDYPDFGWSAVEWIEKDLTDLSEQIAKLQKVADAAKHTKLDCCHGYGSDYCYGCRGEGICMALAELEEK